MIIEDQERTYHTMQCTVGYPCRIGPLQPLLRPTKTQWRLPNKASVDSSSISIDSASKKDWEILTRRARQITPRELN